MTAEPIVLLALVRRQPAAPRSPSACDLLRMLTMPARPRSGLSTRPSGWSKSAASGCRGQAV